jgi:thymidylate synthase ThyX
MTKIEAKVIKHSKCPRGHELITYELIFPRFLLAELNTHRMFSKNSASSRAIPFKKMVEMIQNDPFIPIAWQKEHKGMQGTEYLTGDEAKIAELRWLQANVDAIHRAQMLNLGGVTKQLCNRLLEPFMWHKVLLTTGKEGLQNFFELRCPQYKLDEMDDYDDVIKTYKLKSKREILALGNWYSHEREKFTSDFTNHDWLMINKGQAEIHMMELAESMYDTYNKSVPQNLKEDEWHIPYDEELLDLVAGKGYTYKDIIKASTGLCARTSYIIVGDEKIPSIETLISIHDKMRDSVPFHASPFEHCSTVMTEYEYACYTHGYPDPKGGQNEDNGWCKNFRGFIQYRDLIENVNN